MLILLYFQCYIAKRCPYIYQFILLCQNRMPMLSWAFSTDEKNV